MWMLMAPWPHWAAYRHSQPIPGTVSVLFSLSLQSSKAVQGLTGLRNLGNTVSVYQGTWLHSPSSPSALLWAHLWSSGELCPFTSPLASTLSP